MKTLVFASANSNKIKEVSSKLGGYPLLGLTDIGCHEELPETGRTLEENALQKAEYVYNHYNCDCFADDTGLEIEALNNEPGVDTAFYAGPERNAEANMNKVLENLKDKNNRRARFKTVIVLITGGTRHQFTGIVKGTIAPAPKGTGGFGYDPIFIPDGYEQTFAELSMEIKNSISHRGKAIGLLAEFLENQPKD